MPAGRSAEFKPAESDAVDPSQKESWAVVPINLTA